MLVRFWGTRGSLAKPGTSTIRYGGNTSCVEVRSDDGQLFVLDCGTGAHALGISILAQAAGRPVRGHLFITHTHWDHIQGFPFFGPLFAPNAEWDIYAPSGFGQRMQETLAGQMQYTYFPVDLRQLGATIRYHDLTEQSFDLGRVRITTQYLNHPALTVGYRIEEKGSVLVYATDHEPHERPKEPAAAPAKSHNEEQGHLAFVSGADLLIHDAQYTNEEYPAKLGWGHSTVEYVTDLGAASGAKQIALFHHDPLRSDAALDELVARCRKRLVAAGSSAELFAAAEGYALELHASGSAEPTVSSTQLAPVRVGSMPARAAIVYYSQDPGTTDLIHRALASEGMNLMPAELDMFVEGVHTVRPALVIIDLPATDARLLYICRRLRASEGPNLPIIVSGPPADADAVANLFASGATDFIAMPYTLAYLRTRARAWLMRTKARWAANGLPAADALRPRPAGAPSSGSVRGIKSTPPAEERFQRLTRLAAQLFDVPFAFLGLMDGHDELRSSLGALPPEPAQAIATAADTFQASETVVVPDLARDPRFAQHAEVSGGVKLRFFAGQRVRNPAGQVVGAIVVIDQRPRELGERQLQAMKDLARLTEDELRIP